jgi:hypothetical protein
MQHTAVRRQLKESAGSHSTSEPEAFASDSDPIANIEIHPSEGYVNTGIAKAVGVSKSGNPQVDRNAGGESELLRNLDYVKSD